MSQTRRWRAAILVTKLWFGRKADIGGHVRGLQAIWIISPFLRRDTARDRRTHDRGAKRRQRKPQIWQFWLILPARTSVLPRHSPRCLALLEKAGLVDHQGRIVIRQMLDDIIADNITQTISIPIPATENRLLPPRARIASCLCAHPTSFALLISEQAFTKNKPALVATRSCVNNGRIRCLISRSDAAHNASVSSIDAARAHDLRIMVAHRFSNLQKRQL